MGLLDERSEYIGSLIKKVSPVRENVVYEYMTSLNPPMNVNESYIIASNSITKLLIKEILYYKNLNKDIRTIAEEVHKKWLGDVESIHDTVEAPEIIKVTIPKFIVLAEERGMLKVRENDSLLGLSHSVNRISKIINAVKVREYFSKSNSEFKLSGFNFLDDLEDKDIESVIDDVFGNADNPIKQDILNIRLNISNVKDLNKLFLSFLIVNMLTSENNELNETEMKAIREIEKHLKASINKVIEIYEDYATRNIFVTYGDSKVVAVMEKPYNKFIENEEPIELLLGIALDNNLNAGVFKAMSYDKVIENGKKYVDIWNSYYKNRVTKHQIEKERELKSYIISSIKSYISKMGEEPIRFSITQDKDELYKIIKRYILAYNKHVGNDDIIKIIDNVFKEFIYKKTSMGYFMDIVEKYMSKEYGFNRHQALSCAITEIVSTVIAKTLSVR